MGKRNFFKKDDVLHKYKVVPRSQQDPLIADQSAPKSVLVDIAEGEKYGIYFDDNYDYLQHLKGVQETVDWQDAGVGEVYVIRAQDQPKNQGANSLTLPSSVFESYVEEPIGMLNKAAPLTGPQPQLDPDIVAQLDDGEIINETDFDDFDQLLSNLNKDSLNGVGAEMDDSDVSSDNLAELYDICEESFNSCDDSFGKQQGKGGMTNKSESGFTEYSLTSVNMPRSEHMEFMNRKFEAFYLREYAEDTFGALDEESTRGHMDAKDVFSNMITPRYPKGFAEDFPQDKEWNKKYIMSTEKERAKPQKIVQEKKPCKLKYDVVTIHEARKALNSFRPQYFEDKQTYKKIKLTKITLERHNEEYNSDSISDDSNYLDGAATLKTALSLASVRCKYETQEERLNRKRTLKELRRKRREEKKITKIKYKELKKKFH